MGNILKLTRSVVFVYYLWICLAPDIPISTAKKVQYISTEHPRVTYFNPKHMSYINLTSKRYGRGSPMYYVGLHVETLTTVGNNLTVDFFFYEFLSNVYKRSFVEMHYRLCDLIHKDRFFGMPMKQGKLVGSCPYPPGVYNMYNMSIDLPAVPTGFPFTKGRIYANVTFPKTKEIWAYLYIDMEIKEINI